MQTIVDNWNQSTEEVLQKYDNVYFVPVNDLLYKELTVRAVLQALMIRLSLVTLLKVA